MKKSLSGLLAFLLLLTFAATALAAGGEGGYSDAQIKDILFRVMNFAAFFAILFYFLKKPICKFFRERSESIAHNLEYLETQARNLEEQNEIMSKQIAGIASERESILAQYERQGRKEAERILAEAKATSEAIIQKAHASMELEIKAARQTLLAEIARLSTQAAGELVKNNINDDDQKRLTGEFMAQVDKLKSAGN